MKRDLRLADGETKIDFPENQLGASLKPTPAPAVTIHCADFPENQLGASLKRVVAVRSCCELQEHFPENQLGASLKRMLDQLVQAATIALPREPTRGLIEEISTLSASSSPAVTSPRTNSGPH